MNNTNSIPTPTTTAPSSDTGYVAPTNTEIPAPATTPVVEEKSTDDYGYSHETKLEEKSDLVKTEEEKKNDEPTTEDKKPVEEEKPIDPSTGYEKEIPKPTEKKPDEPTDEDKKDDEKPPEELLKEDVTEMVKSLGEGYDTEGITKLALDNKFTKEQVQAYMDYAKSQDQSNATANESAKLEQRTSWHNELQDDVDFSGQNGEDFMKSVDRVNKVLDNVMVNTKKMLKEKDGMLPPYIMRDLLNMDRILNPKSKLVGGGPSTPVKKDSGNFLEELYE